MGAAERVVVVPNAQGLHARPIARIAEIARRYRARATIRHEDREVDARSILELMTLCAPRGSRLTIRAEGEDAEALVQELAALVADGFGEKD